MTASADTSTTSRLASDALTIARARWLLDRLHVIYLGGGATAAGLTVGLMFMAPSLTVLAWGGVALAYFLACRRLNAAARSAAIQTVQHANRWHRYAVAASVFQGLKWGAAAWLFLDLAHFAQALLVLGVLVSVVAGSMLLLTSHPRCYAVLSALVMLPLLVRLLEAGSDHLALGLLLLGSAAVGVYLVFDTHDSLVERLQDDLEHRQLAKNLERALARAQAQCRQRDALLAHAAHDLRAPVVALELLAEDLLRSPRPAIGLDHKHRHLRDELHGISLMLDSMLDLEDDTASPPLRECVDLDRLLGATVARFNPLARMHNVRLQHLPSARHAMAPPAALRRILDNLVTNALRHTRGGRVVLAVRRHGTRLRLEVRDSGAGISPDVRHQVFQHRTMGDDQASSPMRRSGLGLAIVEQLAAHADIDLILRSAPGRGTVVGLVLPKVAPSSSTTLSSEPEAHGSA